MIQITPEEIMDIEFDAITDFDLFVFMVAAINQAAGAYANLGLTAPEWLTEKQNEATSALTVRIKAEKARELKRLRARRETLATPSEQREKIEARMAALEKELA